MFFGGGVQGHSVYSQPSEKGSRSAAAYSGNLVVELASLRLASENAKKIGTWADFALHTGKDVTRMYVLCKPCGPEN